MMGASTEAKNPTHPLAYTMGAGHFRDIKPEFQQLAMNSWRSPERVVVCHMADEVYLRLRDLRSARF
jgi:hypothetical protein